GPSSRGCGVPPLRGGGGDTRRRSAPSGAPRRRVHQDRRDRGSAGTPRGGSCSMELALIIGGSVLAGLILIGFAVWAHQYTKVGPNEVLIISGRRRRKGSGYRVVRRGGTYVRPFREKVQRLSLELMQFDVRTAETYTMHGVSVQVDGVCMVKVDSTDSGIQQASEQFLSRGREDIVRTAMQAIEGHLRSA